MKIVFPILFSLFLLNSICAQEFEIHFADTIAYSQPGPLSFFIIDGHATNLSTTDTLTLTMVRVQNNLPSQLWTSSICLGSCAAPFVDSIAHDIPPDSSAECSIDFYTDDTIPGTASVLIKFATRNNSQVETQWFIGSTLPNGIQKTNPISSQNFQLFSNYPNPFNNQTVISALINTPGKVELQIYDVLGREVYSTGNNASSPGIMTFPWHGINNDGLEMSSGIYFYRLTGFKNENIVQSQIKKLTLLR